MAMGDRSGVDAPAFRGQLLRAWQTAVRTACFTAALVCALPASSQEAEAPASSPAVVAAARAASEPPVPITRCVMIRDAGFSWVKSDTEDSPNTDMRVECAKENSTGPLTGVGDILITVDKRALKQFLDSKQVESGRLALHLNGVSLPHDALRLAWEDVGDVTLLRFRIQQGAEVQRLWSMLYADGSLTTPQDLHVALGWQPATGGAAAVIPIRVSSNAATVRVTTVGQLLLALALAGATLVILIFIGSTTDTLRDASTPAWWADAKAKQRALLGLKDDAARDARLAALYPDYNPLQRESYAAAAAAALTGNLVKDADIAGTTIGLALRTDRWRPIRATFSLSRTQLALWFTFTIGTGLFLWLLYGDLRRIDGSLLVLLGISVGTASVSWLADRGAADRQYQPSAGFWADLLTGFDERKQLYRYQAVVVNILLLLVGIYHVVQQLSYPVFDSTWLIFLGISGTTYGIGKQLMETK